MLFEAFNFEYFGPINGHNLNHLIDILENIKSLKEPVLLHVQTKKGKGYPPAEKNPVYFHGCGKFEVTTGECIPSSELPPTYTQVFGACMVQMAETDPRIIAVTAAMPEGTGLTVFAKRFPDRFFDVGIAEQHGVTFAAGLATQGLRPVVAIYSTFLQRAYDQIVHDVCIESLPVIFAIDRGGIVGEDGATHHGLFDLAFLRSLPNMVVMSPKDENELRRMLLTASEYNGPIAVRYPRGPGEGVAFKLTTEPIPIGQSEIVKSHPSDQVLILAIGRTVGEALLAHKQLAQEGVGATVVNARFVKPLDSATIVSLAQRLPLIITVEEHVRQGGFGSAIAETLFDQGIAGLQMVRLGVDDVFVEHGSQKRLRQIHGIDAEAIAAAARDLVSRRKSSDFGEFRQLRRASVKP
jgi:1-deoxy-D-xylulose-5-phosphate synthase